MPTTSTSPTSFNTSVIDIVFEIIFEYEHREIVKKQEIFNFSFNFRFIEPVHVYVQEIYAF